MILPNKLIPYKDSILAKMVFILDLLVIGDENIEILYEKTKDKFEDINQYILTLDVLFALEKIVFDEKQKAVNYVKANYM